MTIRNKIVDFSPQLTWLIRLRWSAILGQLTLVVLVDKVFLIKLSFFWVWALVFLIFLSNLGLHCYRRYADSIPKGIIGATLTLDTLILTGLLYLTGGPTNPFSIVYLLHVSIAALLLGGGWTWTMVALSAVGFSGLFLYHIEVPELAMHHHGSGGAFSVHLYGMLFAFCLVAILSGFFLSKMSEALKAREQEIGNLRLLAAHDERLASLTTLAGGAAHELGTPLSTICLAASELKQSLIKAKMSSEITADVDLILSQIDRCKVIIENMSGQAGELVGEVAQPISKDNFCNALESRVAGIASNVTVDFENISTVRAPQNALMLTLLTLIKNSVDASSSVSPVRVAVAVVGAWTEFTVMDSGKGISPEVLRHVGEPFFTTKEPGKGMGLGIFLAKLFASRLGGVLDITSELGKGTTAILRLPRAL